MPRTLTIAAAAFLTLTVTAGDAFAQAGTGRGGGQQGRARMTAERLMEMDANGDGKLTKDEVPERLAERMFDLADTNKDGGLELSEIEAYFASRQSGQGRGGGAQAETRGFSDHMSAMNRAYRQLRRSGMNAESMEADLKNIGAIQTAIVGAKGSSASVAMSAQAKEKFGDDSAAYQKAIRMALLKALTESIKIESALLDGDADAARASVARLGEAQKAGHGLFKEEEQRGGEGRGAGSGEGRRRGGGGRGTGAGGGGGGIGTGGGGA